MNGNSTVKILSVLLLMAAGNIFSQDDYGFKYSYGETAFVSSTAGGTSIISSVGGSITGAAYSENKVVKVKSVGSIIISNGVAGIDSSPDLLPDVYSLKQNYPNPFNPSTIIEYTVPKESFVSIVIYSVLGEKVAELVNERISAGTYKLTWTATNLPTGIYVYTMRSGDFLASKKLLLLK